MILFLLYEFNNVRVLFPLNNHAIHKCGSVKFFDFTFGKPTNK